MTQKTATVKLSYDSLSRVVEDTQTYDGNTRTATNEQFTSYPVTQQQFPQGRQITNVFDPLYRRMQVGETGGSAIANWEFFGPGRVAEVKLAAASSGANLYQTNLNNARTRSAVQSGQTTPGWGDQSSDRLGYDAAGRMTTKRYLLSALTSNAYSSPSAVMGQTTQYDKSSNKLFERELHADERSHLYEPFDNNGNPLGGYDSVDRLRQYQRGTLASGGGSVSSAIALPGTDQSRTYELDGLGNWRRTEFDPVGGTDTTEVRQHNGLNQITSIKDGADAKIPFSYDGATGASNGNLANDGVRSYQWDALNRLKVVTHVSDSQTIGEYTYDALGRRIRKVVSNGGLSGDIPDGTTDYLYHSGVPQCIEERDGDDDPTKQFVRGSFIDEIIQIKTLVSITTGSGDSETTYSAGAYYPLQDTLYRTTALADSSGAIVEVYDWDAYGNTLIFNAAGTGSDWWADDARQVDNSLCEHIFTGRRYDAETAIYFYRARDYISQWGRFLSKDMEDHQTNPYNYSDDNPLTRLDALGLHAVCSLILPLQRRVLFHFNLNLPGPFSSSWSFLNAFACYSLEVKLFIGEIDRNPTLVALWPGGCNDVKKDPAIGQQLRFALGFIRGIECITERSCEFGECHTILSRASHFQISPLLPIPYPYPPDIPTCLITFRIKTDIKLTVDAGCCGTPKPRPKPNKEGPHDPFKDFPM